MLPPIFTVICHRDDTNFSFTVTPSPEYLCLGDLVQLNCSAQGSVTWESDDILGPGQRILFVSGDSINTSLTEGNGTGVLLETDPRFVTSLSFNLTADRVETSCTDYQSNTTTTISSVQPSEFQVIYFCCSKYACGCVHVQVCACIELINGVIIRAYKYPFL